MYLAIDYGSRYIGLAATDIDGKITYRYGTLDQKQVDVFEEIPKIVQKERVATIIIGLPIGLEGQETQQTTETRRFISLLTEALPSGMKIETLSEALSSVEARGNIQAEGGNENMEHAEAARILLEEYLTSL